MSVIFVVMSSEEAQVEVGRVGIGEFDLVEDEELVFFGEVEGGDDIRGGGK
jgi:hypothetical protein